MYKEVVSEVNEVRYVQVSTYMIKDPPIVNEDSRLIDALKVLNEKGVGRVIVGDSKGIISTRDILSVLSSRCRPCVQASLAELSEIPVSEIMTPLPVTVDAEADIQEALALMVSRNFGSLPVVRNNKTVGIVVERNFLIEFMNLSKVLRVSQFMTRKVSTGNEEMSLYEALHVMTRRGFRRLPIVKGQRLIGIITAYDLLKIVTRALIKLDDQILRFPVEKYMTKELKYVEPEDFVNDAATIMLTEHIGSLLHVGENHEILGILTERDLLLALYHQLIESGVQQKTLH
ncbi:histidine kinase [Sulfolobales archaeon HS-7]|nr:histidine kinase [Sulfolobales archaeon HS-7]